MPYEWDDKLTEKFLTLYRKHKCLWNPYSPDYKNCTIKNEAFRIVIQELNVPNIRISECLHQIEIIRERYKREQLKVENALKAGRTYASKSPWFNLMSQMLCEVINDEENFSKVPVRILPDIVTKDLKKSTNEQSRKNELERELKTRNDTNDPWNACPTSCGWETRKNQFDNREKGTETVYSGMEVPLRIKPTKILGANSKVEEMSQLIPPPRCPNETNRLNWKTKTPELNTMENRETVRMSAGIESLQDNGVRLYVSAQQQKCNVTEDEVQYLDDGRAKNYLDDISTKVNHVHYPKSNKEFEKNVTACPGHVNDIRQSQFLEKQLQNFETNQANNCLQKSRPNLMLDQDDFTQQSQKILKLEDRTNGGEQMSYQRCDTCIKQFKEHGRKLDTTEDDKCRICSGFKIIIPNSDRDDQSLEITGYEIRLVNPKLSKYTLCPSSEKPISNIGCACKSEFSIPDKNAKVDAARCGNIIQLNINHKHSKEPRAKKPSHRGQVTDNEIDQDPETETQPKSFSNKKTQSNCPCEDESIQVSGAVKTSKFNSSKSTRDRERVVDDLSTNRNSYQAQTLDENHSFIQQHQSTLTDDSIVSRNTTISRRVEDNSLPVDKFNNTRLFLNVIVKILESDDTQDVSESLQTTLDTMLDRIEQVPIIGQSDTEYRANNSQDGNTINDDTMSTRYESLALNLAPANRRNRNINSQKPPNEIIDFGNTTVDSRPQTIQLDDTGTDVRPQSLILREADNTADDRACGSRRKSWPFDETDKSINPRNTRNEMPVSIMEHTNLSVDSNLDYTNEFSNEEPVASSSRRFRERRSPNQLTKDFLDVIKFTMMMDGALEPTENGNKDCCSSRPN